MISRKIGRVAVLAAGLLAAVVVPAATSSQVAAAQVPGMQTVSTISAFDSVSPKQAIAVCPKDTVVIYGGGIIIPGFAQDQRRIVLTRLSPGPGGLTSYRADATEVGNFGIQGNWLVIAHAVCAPQPRGYKFENPFPGRGDDSVRDSPAPCSQDDRVRHVIGSGGFLLDAPAGQATLQSIGPLRDFSGGNTRARLAPGVVNDFWDVGTATLCMDKDSGSAWAIRNSAVNSDVVKSVVVTCEGPGELIHSAGGVVRGASGRDAPAGVGITGIVPHVNLRSATVTAVASRFTNENWVLTATAVCR